MMTPDDIGTAAEALQALAVRADDHPAWSAVAAPTSWSAARTVDHIVDSLIFYAGQVVRRAPRRLPVVRDGRIALPSDQLDNVLTAAGLLMVALRDLGAARAWHPSGSADGAGWSGMAVTEILVHGIDTARALDIELDLPAEVCARTVARVFPWVRPGSAPPADLLAAVTGRKQVLDVPSDPDWWWQSAPLDEWDGQPRRRDVAPGWI